MIHFLLLALVAPIHVLASSNYTFPSGFNLALISSTTKASWCLGERNSCPKICGGSASVNYCDSDTLDFTCTCTNGSAADVALYQETIPFYVCQANYGQCISASTTQDGDDACKANLSDCGSLNASATTTTSTASATATATLTTTTASGNASTATATETSTSATATGAAVQLMQNHGVAVFATVVFGALGFLL